ncbi:MAG: hypothetical protein JXR95_09330 [Deltaproteobacteria bacterium]|nr:hypothetical protein [Deltaproteobacteria bacterium]
MNFSLRTSHPEIERKLVLFLSHAFNPPFLPCGYNLLEKWSSQRRMMILELGIFRKENSEKFSEVIDSWHEELSQLEIFTLSYIKLMEGISENIGISIGKVKKNKNYLKKYLSESVSSSDGYFWKI